MLISPRIIPMQTRITRHTRRYGAGILLTVILALTGCELWRPPPVTSEELGRGLVVLYPGSFNTTSELIGFYFGLREGGVDHAIEVVQWALSLDHIIDPAGAQVRTHQRAAAEAERIFAYKQAHPGRPVTLLGYSAGCWFATLTAERMPPNCPVDRVIMMSPAFDKKYDLTAALANTRLGIVSFWSAKDLFTLDIRDTFNLADSTRFDPAATFSFDMDDPALVQVAYDPAWADFGHYGGHADYLFLVGWLSEFVAPWVAIPD